MERLGKEATRSGEPQTGIKGVCPLLAIIDNLPFQAATLEKIRFNLVHF